LRCHNSETRQAQRQPTDLGNRGGKCFAIVGTGHDVLLATSLAQDAWTAAIGCGFQPSGLCQLNCRLLPKLAVREPVINEELRSKLVAMAEHDLQVRAELVESSDLCGGYNIQMAAIHKRNADSLDNIIDEFGWPGRSLVGSDGAEAAWLILQHAIGSPNLQRKCLEILEEAVESGEVPAFQVAFLEDRIRVFEERPQRYGTQFDWDRSGNLSPHPIEDPERVDEYRESVGLGPLAEKIRDIRQRAAEEGHEQPDDFDGYRERRRAWARSVGWL